MSIEELKAAIERIGGDYEGSRISIWKRAADKEAIANAFTDSSPITREGLEAVGGYFNGGRVVFCIGEIRVYAQLSLGEFWLSYALRPTVAHEPFKPQPQTVGDLMFLLWRLSRTGVDSHGQ